jgi:NADH-quinone oxidoreductase subunit L
MVRVYALTFAGKPRTHVAEHAHESSPLMTVPLWVLAILSIVALVLGLPHGFGGLSEIFKHFTDPVFRQALDTLGPEHAHPAWPFLVAWLVAVAFGALAWAMYVGGLREFPAKFTSTFRGLHRLVQDKFRVDELYDVLILTPVKTAAYWLWRVGDAFLIDGLLVNGAAKTADFFSRAFRFVQNGDVQRYAAIMAAAAAVILWTVLGLRGS